MNLLRKLALILVLLVSGMKVNAQGKNVVVYLDAVGAFDKEEMLINYEAMTHIIWSFVIPTSNGTLTPLIATQQATLSRMTAEAHKYGVKVLVAVGGASGSTHISSVIGNTSTRSTLIGEISQIVQDYNLDGVDMDYEFPAAWEANNFAAFMTEMKAELDVLEGAAYLDKEMELSLAANAFTAQFTNGINATAMAACDFINLMAYDNGSMANHADNAFVATAISHWSNKGLAKSKMCLGLPSYGRSAWSGSTIMTYADILNMGSGTDAAWWSSVDEGNGTYYNGLPTICSKTQTANSEGLYGVMLWEASFDVLKNDPNYQYSIIEKMASCIGLPTCDFANVPTKVELCGGSATIDASMGAGYTYEWKKGNAVVGTNSSLTVSSTGDYSITVKTTAGCSRMSEFEVVNETPLTLIPSDTMCISGQVELKVANTGGPFNWYSAQSGGSSLYTGGTYTPTLSTTTTYYVEGVGSNASDVFYTASAHYPDTLKGWFQDYSGAGTNDLRFFAYEAFEIDSVTVYVNENQMGKTIKVSILAADGTTEVSSTTVTVETNDKGPLRVGVNLSVPKAATADVFNYITLTGGTAELWLDNSGGSYPINEFGLLEIKDVRTSFNFDGSRIPGIYKIGVHWNEGAGGCARYPVTAVVDLCVGENEITANKFNVYPNPTTGSFTVNLSEYNINDVELRLFSLSGKVIKRIQNPSQKEVFGDDLTAGIYFLEVIENGTSSVQKLIKK